MIRTKRVEVNKVDKYIDIIAVTSVASPEFLRLESTLSRTSVVGIDAEWDSGKTLKTNLPPGSGVDKGKSHEAPQNQLESPQDTVGNSSKTAERKFHFVCLLQIACESNNPNANSVVFLVDMVEIKRKDDLTLIKELHKLLKGMFESPNIVKLVHGLENDMKNLSSTFQKEMKGCDSGLDEVIPAFEIFETYKDILLFRNQPIPSKNSKKLTSMSEEILNLPLDKVYQLHSWSKRPLEAKAMDYAAIDAFCLIEIFNVYRAYVRNRGSSINTIPMDNNLLWILGKKVSNTLLKSRTKDESQPIFEGPPPWDISKGGDGKPKFLCGDKLRVLATQLRSRGIDTKLASCEERRTKLEGKDPIPIRLYVKELLNRAQKEKRVLLTTDPKPDEDDSLNYYLLSEAKSHGSLELFDQVFEDFDLKIVKDGMSRCPRCNTEFKTDNPVSLEDVRSGKFVFCSEECEGIFYKRPKVIERV